MRPPSAFVIMAALVLVTAGSTIAQKKPDFSGTWTLDPDSGIGPPRLTVTQDIDTLTVATSFDKGGLVLTTTYNLDGSESMNQAFGSPAVVSRATGEGDRLVIVTPRNVGGKDVEQRDALAMAGADLVFETTRFDLQGGSSAVRLVYTKSP
jgi:hypothetical protein